MSFGKSIKKINQKSPDVVPLTLDTYLPDSVGKGVSKNLYDRLWLVSLRGALRLPSAYGDGETVALHSCVHGV